MLAHNMRRVSLLLLVMVVCGLVSTSSALGSGRKLYIPFATNDSRADTPFVSSDLRLDSIAMWELDQRLIEAGYYDATFRTWVYNTELNRRNSEGTGYGSSPEAYPGPTAPNAEPELNGVLIVNCNSGQACGVIWKGFGSMRSHFQEEIDGWQLWGVGVRCPGAVCTVLSSIAGDTRVNVRQKRWVRFGTSSLGVPVYLAKSCLTIT